LWGGKNMSLSIEELGRLVVQKRGSRGVRAAAAEVEISSATLSRVENGHMPDLATFAKICRWLDKDPREFLGFEATEPASQESATVHFRKKKTVSRQTAVALGDLIMAAQAAIRARSRANE
jgi:transcriptional regulator with XRE-family HTH domain